MAYYRLSPAAEQDLEEIWIYTAHKWSAQQAEDYFGDLLRGLDMLAANPRIGRKMDRIRPGYRRFHVAHHLIFYTEQGQHNIDVIRILHENSDVTSRLGET